MKKVASYVLVFVLGFVVCGYVVYELRGQLGGGVQVTSTPPGGAPNIVKPGNHQVRDAARKVSDYVVNIDTLGKPVDIGGGLFPFFPEPERRIVPTGQGSGVIFTPNGYIITNNHVVEDAAKMTVTLRNGRKFPAKLIGRDPRSEIAVIKIDANGLRAAPFADSSKLEPGDWVIAVGSPLRLEFTVTVGVVSATKRGPIQVGNRTLTDLIQTDCAINPGNSGGALADLNGNLIGINTLIFSPSGGSIGIGFAIPSNTARRVATELIKHGKVKHAYLGIKYIPYNADAKRELEAQGVRGLPDVEGARIMEVLRGGPADRAGLQPEDVIIKVNGKQISGTGSAIGNKVSLTEEVSKAKVGQRMLLEVWHASNGQIGTVAVRLAELPENPPE